MTRSPGYTLVELLLAAFLSVILAGLTAGSYASIQREIGEGQNDLELAQNGRAVIDRISRDVRQATIFVTTLPALAEDGVTTFEFEDGHEVSEDGPTYIQYLLDGTDVRRSRYYYYLEANPERRLPYDSGIVGENGFTKQITESDSYVIAENVASIAFYGSVGLLQIDVTLQSPADDYSLPLHSAVATRN